MDTSSKRSNRINGILILLAFLFGIALTTIFSTNASDPVFLGMLSPNNKAGSTSTTNNSSKINITTTPTTVVPRITALPTISVSPTPLKMKDLTVKWLKEPVQLKPNDIGLTADKALVSSDEKDLNKAFTIYNVGTINTAPFANKHLLLVYTNYGDATGTNQLHVVDDHLNKGLIALQWNHAALDANQQKVFTTNFEYDIPALHLPPRLSLTYQNSNLSLEAEDYGIEIPVKEFIQNLLTSDRYPLPGLATAQLIRSKGITLNHPQYGPLVELPSRGYFYLQRPDSTVMLYHLSAPISPQPKINDYEPTAYNLTLDLSDGTTHQASYSNTLNSSSQYLCPPQGYFVFNDTIKSHLTQKGTFMNMPFFELAPNDSLYASLLPANTSRNDIDHEHPFIFTQDALGRWMGLKNTKFINIKEGECWGIAPNTL